MVSLILIECKYLYLLLIICLDTVKYFQVLQFNTNSSIKHQSYVYTQLKDQTVSFESIQFSVSHLFAISLAVKQSYLTHRSDPIRCNQLEPEW